VSDPDVVRIESEKERLSREANDNARLTGPWYGRVAEIGARWLTAQTFTNVLLVAVLFGGGYVAIKLVPIHLDQIQKGYENIQRSSNDLIRKMNDDHRQEREFLYQMMQSKRVVSQ
jgi:hypothetical protein